MRLKTLLFLICLLGAFGLQAQKKEKKGLKLGVRLGLNRSAIAFKDGGGIDLETTAKTAINGGLYLRWYLLKGRVIIQPEMLYSREGFTYDSTLVSNADQENVRANFSLMNMPVSIIVRPFKNFNIQLGPSISYMMQAVQKSDNIDKENINELMNRAEVALNFGVGVRVLKIFNINLRYKRGLTPITKGEVDELQSNPLSAVDLFNEMFQVSVGLNFPGKDGFGNDASAQNNHAPALEYQHFKQKRTLFKRQDVVGE